MHTTFDLAVLVALAETSSLTEAARICGVTRATVTRRLDALEQSMGMVLANRSTRQVVLTEAGASYAESCRGALAHLRRAEASLKELDGTPRGQLRVAGPITRLVDIVGPLVTEFAQRHPDIDVQIIVSSEQVDPIADQYDIAVRVGHGSNPALITRCLARESFNLYASPDYLARRGLPKSYAELAEHDCIVALREGASLREDARESWPLRSGGSVRLGRPRLLANSSELVRHAALTGLGIGLIAGSLVRQDVDAGALLPVLLDEVGDELPISLLYAASAKSSAKVRSFVDYALEWAKRYTQPGQGASLAQQSAKACSFEASVPALLATAATQ